MTPSKKTQRVEVFSILKTLSPNRRQSGAIHAGNQLFNTDYWRTAHHILAYMPLNSELDTGCVFDMAWREGKKIFVPRVDGRNLIFCLINSFEDSLEVRDFGVREPKPQAKVWKSRDYSKTTLILVPGLAFDMEGHRLGRGAGFYDRFLSGIRSEARNAEKHPPLCLGFAFEEQIMPEVLTDKHDEKMDGLVSDKRFVIFNKRVFSLVK